MLLSQARLFAEAKALAAGRKGATVQEIADSVLGALIEREMWGKSQVKEPIVQYVRGEIAAAELAAYLSERSE